MHLFNMTHTYADSLSMARHQAAMNQHNKAVYVLECPPDKDDNIPLPQFIQQLEASGILLKPFMHKKGKTVLPIIWRIDSDVPDHLLGDTMRLTQIILNLLSNAVKVPLSPSPFTLGANILGVSLQNKVVFTFVSNDLCQRLVHLNNNNSSNKRDQINV